MGDEGGERAFGGGVERGLGHGDAHWRPVGIAVEGHHPAHCREREVACRVVGVGAVLAEGRGRHVNEAGVDGAQVVESEAPSRHSPCRVVFEEEVRGANEFEERRAAGIRPEFERYAALVPVVGVEEQALHAGRGGRVDGRCLAVGRATQRLDAHHVSAEVGKNHRAEGCPAGCEVKDAVGSEHGGPRFGGRKSPAEFRRCYVVQPANDYANARQAYAWRLRIPSAVRAKVNAPIPAIEAAILMNAAVFQPLITRARIPSRM